MKYNFKSPIWKDDPALAREYLEEELREYYKDLMPFDSRKSLIKEILGEA